MGILLPIALCLLLTPPLRTHFAIIAPATFLTWGVADLLATILERPRLQNRSATKAIGEEWDRRSHE